MFTIVCSEEEVNGPGRHCLRIKALPNCRDSVFQFCHCTKVAVQRNKRLHNADRITDSPKRWEYYVHGQTAGTRPFLLLLSNGRWNEARVWHRLGYVIRECRKWGSQIPSDTGTYDKVAKQDDKEGGGPPRYINSHNN